MQGPAETDTQGTVTLREPSPAGTGHKGGGIRHTRPSSQGNLTPGQHALSPMAGCPRLRGPDAVELGKEGSWEQHFVPSFLSLS